MFISDLVTLWLVFIVSWVLVSRGVPVFQELIRDMTDFFMEKALGPGADLFEGRAGSGPVAWMLHGMLWTCIGATFTFISMWVGHEPDAIASLDGIGYSPSASQLSVAATLAAEGGIMMLLIGAGLHINGRLSGPGLASDTNAILTSYGYGTGLLMGFVAAHMNSSIGDNLGTISDVVLVTTILGVIANHLLTLGNRTSDQIQPSQWLIVFGLSLPLLMCAVCYVVGVNDAIHESLEVLPMLASALAVAYYVVPKESGVPLWSRALAGATVMLTFVTISPIGVSAAEGALSSGDASVLTIFFAASLIPLMAAAMNVFQTARSNWSAASNSPGTTSVMLGMFLLVASAAGSLFTASDAHSAGDITHMQAPLESLFLWGAMGMIALGGAITCFPAASGRALHSNQTSRTVMWMFAGGATIAFLLSMSAAMTHAAMAEVITANDELELLDMSAVNDLNTLSSIAFYAVAIGAIFMMLNMIRGHFSGSIIGTSSPSGLTAPRMALTPGTTTIRQLLAAGAGIDTEIDVISDAEADEEE